jgi:uncharacterized membrane protein YfcA
MDWLQAHTHFQDLQILLICMVAVVLVGLSKGGLGGAFGLLGVPVMSLVMSPLHAAALLLPVLLMMDAISLWTWRGFFNTSVLKLMLPPAVIGIAIGWWAAAVTSEGLVRLIVGIVALLFVLRSLFPGQIMQQSEKRPLLAIICGTTAGFTSFVAHAGGPPFQIYTIPLRLDPKIYTGTSVVFFAVVNAIKVIPYTALGQFNPETLWSVVVMLPIAVMSTMLGAAVVKRMRPQVFYPFTYVMVTLVSMKLIWDGSAIFF